MVPEIISPCDKQTVCLCAPFQREFYACKNLRQEKKLIKKLLKLGMKNGECSVPAPVEFALSNAENTVIEISESPDFSCCVRAEISGEKAKIFNLKCGTRYFCRTLGGETREFFTENALPRWINAPGFVNIRDFGGETTADGAKIKQGLIYRGPRLESPDSPEGIAALRSLGIKTDIDLRREVKESLFESPLGQDIKFIVHPCEGYDEFITPDVRENTKQLIEYFADESIYPVYFHCHGGQDRTGTLAFMLGAILGLDDEKLIREYEQTALSFPDKKMSRSRKDKLKPLLKVLKKHNKRKTLGENAVDILRECGVSETVFDKIRQILLDG